MTKKVFQQTKIKLKEGKNIRQVKFTKDIEDITNIYNIIKSSVDSDNFVFWYLNEKNKTIKMIVNYKFVKDIWFD